VGSKCSQCSQCSRSIHSLSCSDLLSSLPFCTWILSTSPRLGKSRRLPARTAQAATTTTRANLRRAKPALHTTLHRMQARRAAPAAPAQSTPPQVPPALFTWRAATALTQEGPIIAPVEGTHRTAKTSSLPGQGRGPRVNVSTALQATTRIKGVPGAAMSCARVATRSRTSGRFKCDASRPGNLS
jgi:hypothetical protein